MFVKILSNVNNLVMTVLHNTAVIKQFNNLKKKKPL